MAAREWPHTNTHSANPIWPIWSAICAKDAAGIRTVRHPIPAMARTRKNDAMAEKREGAHASQEGLNRRSLFEAMAAGAAASTILPSSAFAQAQPAIASSADYA